MSRYLIEREIPEAGAWTPGQRRRVAARSNQVLRELGPNIQWLQSYVTGDKLYCAYIASDERLIRDHAARGGFPLNRIVEIGGTMDPASAEG